MVGARPQFIKAAAISQSVTKDSHFSEVLIHTGQHYDRELSDIFFDELKIPPPQYYLGIGSSTHGAQTGRMLERIEAILLKEQPDWVLLYGDTNSTLAGALAAAKLHIPIAHVEAGLRSFNRSMPEEINRVTTDHVSTLLFAPSETARFNLMREGIGNENIAIVGDVMLDAALSFGDRASNAILASLNVKPGGFALATVHRAENTGTPQKLSSILRCLDELGKHMPVVLPMHPRTRQKLTEQQQTGMSHIQVINPVGYLDMLALERAASVIVTDSGGIQKEAYYHRVPCVTLRDETEWIELIETGWNHLASPESLEATVALILATIGTRGEERHLYGDGTAATQILARMKNAGL